MRRLCYLYTDFQRVVFRAALAQSGLSETEFRFITHGYCNDQRLESPVRIKTRFRGLQYDRARAQIREVNHAVSEQSDEEEFELWLASDNSGIGQILIHHPRCRRVILFEDGLANYGVHYPMLSRKNLQIELFRLRNLMLLFPHYRLPKRAGEYPRADHCYALTTHSFPYAERERVIRIDPKHFSRSVGREAEHSDAPRWDLVPGDLLFIDAFKDRERADARRPMITRFLADLVQRKGCKRVLVRPHPGAQGDFVSETIRELGQQLLVPVECAPAEGLVETAFWHARDTSIQVAGLVSTALMTARLISPDSAVHCLGSAFERRIFSSRDRILSALRALGVELH